MTDAFIPETGPVPEQTGRSFEALVSLMRRLLAPDGCPWDREQTTATLRPYVLEEACEVMDAIDAGDPKHLCEELGDLALQIAFLAELGRAEGSFGPDDVMRGICEKLVRRHPHVFADVAVTGPEEVARNWSLIKHGEKAGRPLLAGVPRALPSLGRAERLSRKVAEVGFDWPDGRGSRAKVQEELQELDEALERGKSEEIQAELGDLLFALVNLARHHGVDAERALAETMDRFCTRFDHVEKRVLEEHGAWPLGPKGKPGLGIPLAELDAYWDEAKQQERRAPVGGAQVGEE